MKGCIVRLLLSVLIWRFYILDFVGLKVVTCLLLDCLHVFIGGLADDAILFDDVDVCLICFDWIDLL